MTDADPAEQIAIRHDPQRGIDMIHLPDAPYYDTQAGAVDIGLDRETVYALRAALDTWIAWQEFPRTGCNTSMACVMRNGCPRCRPAEEPQP